MEIKTKTRKWGNSIAVILPSEFVRRKRIDENQEITIEVKTPALRVEQAFGMLREWKRSTQELKDEARKEWGDGH